MALDKLVDSTQLDANLTSVANAIRAKSGGSSQLAFPAGFVDAIDAIPTGGGGTRSESGSFTVASGYITEKSIAHNLNTTKIFGIIWAEPDENDEIVALTGYALLFSHFITVNHPNDLFDGVTLVENYTSAATKTALYTPTAEAKLSFFKSTWTSQDASWTRYRDDIATCWAEAVSNSEFTIKTNSQNTYMRAGLTYRYKIWSLED